MSWKQTTKNKWGRNFTCLYECRPSHDYTIRSKPCTFFKQWPVVCSQTWLTLKQNCHIAGSIYIVYLERVFTIIIEIENFIEFSLSFLPRFCVRVTVCGCVCVLTFNITTYESACLSLCVRLGACVYITCVRMYESLYELALTKSSTTSLLFRVCFSCWPFSFLQVTFTQFLVISILTYICPPFLYFFHKGI